MMFVENLLDSLKMRIKSAAVPLDYCENDFLLICFSCGEKSGSWKSSWELVLKLLEISDSSSLRCFLRVFMIFVHFDLIILSGKCG